MRVYKTIRCPDQLDLFKWAEGEYRPSLFDIPMLSSRTGRWMRVRHSPHMGDVHMVDFSDIERRTVQALAYGAGRAVQARVSQEGTSAHTRIEVECRRYMIYGPDSS